MVYTRMGDKGITYVKDICISKTHPCTHFLGSIDEAMSFVGLAIEMVENHDIRRRLIKTYNILGKIASAVYTGWCPSDDMIRELEEEIDESPKPTGFIPNYSIEKRTATIAIARTTIRRVERWFWSCKQEVDLCENLGALLNRLSDYVFILQYMSLL